MNGEDQNKNNSEEKIQESLSCENNSCKCLTLEYEYIEFENNLNNAFDILFEEVMKYRANKNL
jgi:hypothetical protein